LNSVIASSIKTIYDEDTSYDPTEVSKKEMYEFIDSLSHKNLESIKDYINNQPTLKHTIKFKCEHCGEDNSIELSNINDFFT
jgi:DNA-directed RNA polymerase subunit M/transcription elongation factor TFIIS